MSLAQIHVESGTVQLEGTLGAVSVLLKLWHGDEPPGECVKMGLLVWWAWVGDPDAAFLTSFQVIWVLLVGEGHALGSEAQCGHFTDMKAEAQKALVICLWLEIELCLPTPRPPSTLKRAFLLVSCHFLLRPTALGQHNSPSNSISLPG